MSVAVANPQVTVNNVAQLIVPNSLKYTEGLGEQNMRAGSSGGGQTEQVYSRNVENNFSMISFELFPTPDDIEAARVFKDNENNNTITFVGTVSVNGVAQTITRTFNNAAILNDYEVALGADTTIPLEFKSDAAV